jgi:hypothetical protein
LYFVESEESRRRACTYLRKKRKHREIQKITKNREKGTFLSSRKNALFGHFLTYFWSTKMSKNRLFLGFGQIQGGSLGAQKMTFFKKKHHFFIK